MIQSRSTYGRRAAICEKFGWTMDYLNHCISYAFIIRCLCDLPRYEYDKDNTKQGEKIKLTDSNADEFAAFIKKINKAK